MTPAVAALPCLELLSFEPMSARGHVWLDAIGQAAARLGTTAVRTSSYRGGSPWLVLWGPGSPDRFPAIGAQLKAHGRVIALDLAYWSRETKARVSIDGAHPPAWVMRRPLPAFRFQADPVAVCDRWDPRGPVLVAGLGPKARVQYGAGFIDRWEAAHIAACRQRWPGRRIYYRHKKLETGPTPEGTIPANGGPIDQALSGVGLVITFHSNVAVDAIRSGIPTLCVDGAAAAVCPAALGDDDPRPLDPAIRDRFLENLAWFQWAPAEAPQMLAFLAETLA